MEHQVLMLLQSAPGAPFTLKEVGKRIDRDKFRKNPNWARPYLETLVLQGLIIIDASGYFIFPIPEKRDDHRHPR